MKIVLLLMATASLLAACSTYNPEPVGIGSGLDQYKRARCAGCTPVSQDWNFG